MVFYYLSLNDKTFPLDSSFGTGAFDAIINVFFISFFCLLVYILLVKNYMVSHCKLRGLKVIEVR